MLQSLLKESELFHTFLFTIIIKNFKKRIHFVRRLHFDRPTPCPVSHEHVMVNRSLCLLYGVNLSKFPVVTLD